jgi:two-component system sensor histidine kinase AtoS
MMVQRTPPILQMKNIYVSYGSQQALNGVDFDLYQGEIHGLVGEHRAGKSTLVKLLSGSVVKDKGTILFKGENIESFSPQSAITYKIGMMYQDLNVLPTLNAVQNIFAGRDIATWYGSLKNHEMVDKARKIFADMHVDIPLNVPLKHLSQEQQQMVELAKVLSIEPDIFIFDEVSSKLTPREMEYIYKLLFDVKQQGKSIIYISHYMDEIFKFADRVTILKNGYRRGTEEIKDLDRIKLIKLTYSFMLSREELENDNRELYLLKKYNESIIKNLPEGVIILDPENRVYIANYAAIQILDVEETNITNQPVNLILKRDSLEQAPDILSKITRQEEYTWNEIRYANDRILKVSVLPFKDEDYRFLGTILLIEDVSKERYFHDYFLRTEKIASVAELAAGVAHEINNPLGIIQNYVALLKRRYTDADGTEKLTKVENELNRIVEIIGSLLSFSKPQKMPMNRIDLIAVVEEVILLIQHKFKEKNIHLVWEKGGPSTPVVGDENRLKQVFINLFINSIEAVTYDGVIEIRVHVPQDEQYVDIAVIDDGYGIPESIRKRIFDPFFTTKIGKQNSGLGLSICQHIIESHQGVITCSNGEKTIFNIRLPIAVG